MQKNQKGSLLVGILVFSSIALIIITGVVSWFALTIKATRTVTEKELAFQISEAGIDYYRWHLAHAPADFRDGYVEGESGGGDGGGEVTYSSSIEIEAESVDDQVSFSPFETQPDSLASGGEYIVWPNDGNDQYNSQSDPNLDGQGNYAFYLSDTASIEIEVRYKFPAANDDSFRYIMDNGTWYDFYGAEGSTWITSTMQSYENLAAGQHVLKILRREDGANIDKFIIYITDGDGLLSIEAEPTNFSEPSTAPPQVGLVMWLDASDINGDGSSVSDGSDIVSWQDKSPRNNDMSQWDGGSVPEKVTDSTFEAAYFNDHDLKSAKKMYSTSPVTDTDIFLVARVDDPRGGTFLNTRGDNILIKLPREWDNNIHWNFPGGSENVSAAWNYSYTDYYLWNFQGSTTQGQSIRNNGIEIATGGNTSSMTNIKKMFLGVQRSNKNEHKGLYMRELLVYDDTLTESEREETERYLRCKWDIGDQDDCDAPIPDPEDPGEQIGLPGETYGPFVHDFFDKNGIKIGEFTLMITAPNLGSTVVTVQSTGTLVKNPEVKRTILSRLAIPSFAKYAFVANDTMRFGEGTIVRGPIHSNGGVRFDGEAYNVVTSSRENYDDPDHSGDNEFGVHTHVGVNDPYPPADVPSRQDVFVAGREFPVPAVDFSGITLDLAEMKSLGQESEGVYLPASGGVGYRIDLQTDDTFDLYEVSSYQAVPSYQCYNLSGEADWGTWSVGSESFVGSYSFPNNGVIFAEDHIWIGGVIDTAKLVIAAGRFPDTPSTHRNIILHDNLLYTNSDGQDVIGLIAQNNIHVPLFSPDNLEINAAMIAQNGRIGRNYYRPTSGWGTYCGSTAIRDTIEIHGMIGSAKRYGFAWSDGTGYINRLIDYDPELLYSPPPSFPLTSDAYETIWWEEVKVDDDFIVTGQGF